MSWFNALFIFVQCAILVIACSFLLHCSGQSLPQTYKGYGYSIGYPYNWEAVNQQGYIALFHDKTPEKSQLATVNVQLLATKKEKGKYDDFEAAYNDFKKQITDSTQQVSFTNEEPYEIKDIKGTILKGKQFTGLYQFEGTPYKQWQIILPSSDGRFVLTWGYTAIASHYDASKALAMKMLKSWQINI